MARVLTSAQMRETDRRTIEELGLPGIVLMENAGAGATTLLQTHLPDWQQHLILILAGSGNNGGDGFVMARRLLQAGGRVIVLLFGRQETLHGDAQIHCQVFSRLGGEIHEITDASAWTAWEGLLNTCGVVVDALFGTGLTRPITGFMAMALQAVAASKKPVLAVDLPSGVCADTGRVLGYALQANWTATFAAEKIGHRLYPGAGLCGAITVLPIGIPQTYLEIPQHDVALNLMDRLHVPCRPPDAHKGLCGRLLILAGSVGMEGAAILTALGALRTGPGLVTVATPAAAQAVVSAGVVEAMTLSLPNNKRATHLGSGSLEAILTSGIHPQVMAIGPGLGTNHWNVSLVTDLVSQLDLPVVLDADALNALAGKEERIQQLARTRHAPMILTPHPGEMARLVQTSVQEVQADRLTVARKNATSWGVWLVLKGANTIIAAPDGRIWINITGNAGLAAGGSGDLLTGIIAGLLAQHWSVESAVRAGVWLHGAAADACAQEHGITGMVASDLLPYIRRLRNQLG
ncbi:MAG: NAD(P)H-hydrate dehydratase [Magnetococcus sp. YQC-5]